MSKLFDSRLADVIRKPVITEKATNAIDLNQYTFEVDHSCLLYTSPSPRDSDQSRMPSSA